MNVNTYSSRSFKRLITYGLVGAAAFAGEFLSFLFLYAVVPGSFKLVIAQTTSFLFGLTISFTGSRTYTFSRGKGAYRFNAKTQIMSYLVLALLNLLISNLFLYVLVHNVHVIALYAKVMVMAMVAIWNFVIFKKLIFRTK